MCNRSVNNFTALLAAIGTGGGGGSSVSGADGAVQFASGGAHDSDVSKFFWDDTAKRLGLGNSSPTKTLDVTGYTRLGGTLCLGPSDLYRFIEGGGGTTMLLQKFVGGVWVTRVTIP